MLHSGPFENGNTVPGQPRPPHIPFEAPTEELEGLRRDVIVRLTAHLPEILDALIVKAKQGNVPAARLMLEVVGLVRRPAVAVAMQAAININPQELRELEEALQVEGEEIPL